MRAVVSDHNDDGVFVVTLYADGATLAVHADPSTPFPVVDVPADISTWAPNLVLLALTEPPTPALPGAPAPVAHVTLVDEASFRGGALIEADVELASRCFAVVCAPRGNRAEVIPADAMVKLVANGLVIQILSTFAAQNAQDLDAELSALTGDDPDTPTF
jgi:DNA-binding transcriptional LysR family regulator